MLSDKSGEILCPTHQQYIILYFQSVEEESILIADDLGGSPNEMGSNASRDATGLETGGPRSNEHPQPRKQFIQAAKHIFRYL